VKARWEALTPREREVMTCVAQGQATEAIAARLEISARTVETHVSRALGKLDLRDRVEATAWMWAEGLVDDADRQRPAEGAPAEETT
jgi:DNA-binding NarL/FixJ family response regulator